MRAVLGAVSVGLLLMAALLFDRERSAQGAATPAPPMLPRGPALPHGLSTPQQSDVVVRPVAEPSIPASRYVALSSTACLAELDARGVAYARERPREGIETPVRLTGPVSGVTFRTLRPKEERSRTPFEVFDCRLVLAISDFAKILVRHGVSSVLYFSAFRPHVPGGPTRAHQHALAIDIAFFGLDNGKAYNVLRDFTPLRGERPCEPRIRAKGPRELRAIACEAAREGIFHVTLTPDYNDKHRDHFHMELVPDATTAYAR